MIVHVRALSPGVSEKISMLRPSRNPMVIAVLVAVLIGRIMIRYMKTKAIAVLNRMRLLNITACAITRITKSNAKFKIVFVINNEKKGFLA